MTLEDVLLADDDDGLYDSPDEEDEEEESPPPAAEVPAPAPEPKPEQPTTVPLHVVAELRAERKALLEQNKQMLELLGKVQQRAAATPGAAPEDLTPKPGESDGEFFGRVINHLLTETQETRKERERRAEREAAALQEQQYVSKVVEDYQAFKASVAPDLVEAGDYLAKPIADQLEKIYPPETVRVIIGGLERDMHQAAEKAGMGYGEYVWKTAIAAGYVPQAERQKQEVAQQKRVKAEAARGIGGAGASAGGLTQMEAVKLFNSGKAGRAQKIAELGGITVEEAFASGAVRKLRK
jgi:hypothetical protein